MTAAAQTLVATVLENREPYSREVELLFGTLLRFGGLMAGAQRAAFFVESVSSSNAERLNRLGVHIEVVPRVSPDIPWANKIRMLVDHIDYDYLVALDNDIVVGGDFSSHLAGHELAARPVDQDPFLQEDWEKLFRLSGLSLPADRYRTTFQGRETMPYFNSGVLILPRRHIRSLREAWLAFLPQVREAAREIPRIRKFLWATDQLALSLAIQSLGLPVRELPVAMNFPIHGRIHERWQPDFIQPLLIHHHHLVTPAGRLMPARHHTANEVIRSVNEFLAPHRWPEGLRGLESLTDRAMRLMSRIPHRLRRIWIGLRAASSRLTSP